jgi:hypothetical protein
MAIAGEFVVAESHVYEYRSGNMNESSFFEGRGPSDQDFFAL